MRETESETKKSDDWKGRKKCTSPSCDEYEMVEDGIDKFGRFGKSLRPWMTILLYGTLIVIVIWLVFFNGWKVIADYITSFFPEIPDIPDIIPDEVP